MLKRIGRNLAYWDEGDGVVFHILGGKDTVFKDSSSRCISALEKLVSKYPTYLIQFCSTESSYTPVIRCALGRNETLHLVNPSTCSMFSYSPLSDDFVYQEMPVDYMTQTKLRTPLSHPPTLVVTGSCLLDTVLKANIPPYFIVRVEGGAVSLFSLGSPGNCIVQALSNSVLAVYTVVPVSTLFEALRRLNTRTEADRYTSLLALSKVSYIRFTLDDCAVCNRELTKSSSMILISTVKELAKLAAEVRERIDPSYKLYMFIPLWVVEVLKNILQEVSCGGVDKFLCTASHEVIPMVQSTVVFKSFADYSPPATYRLCVESFNGNDIPVIECGGVVVPLSAIDF